MEDKRILAAGAGRMGRGIAHMFAYAGYSVTLLDLKERDGEGFSQLADAALAEVEANLIFLSGLGHISRAQVKKVLELIRVRPLASAAGELAAADIVIEGVPETREAKQNALGLIGEHVRADTIVTSTTSSMLVTELQEWTTKPERFLNTHFLNPAYLIPLVEVSPSPNTDESVVEDVIALFEAIGKVPVRCSASPGLIIPRLQSLIMAEACRMVEEGVATPAEIDKAITHGFGPRYATLGVMEFIDWGGVDILYYAGHYLSKALDSPRHAPPEEVTKMMEDGRKGLREGRGYYDFRDMDVEAWQKEKLTRFVTLLGSLGQIPKPGV
ncbi:MAG: 3-hydroxybutyryl-CoA dehydrogenase [Gammaproteobacteria bacterium]|nr:3-hydroxybutyryl-CoA dehydrogenase [Gammaproteobacteria bacterium]